MDDVTRDREFSDRFITSAVQGLLLRHLHVMATIRLATDHEDMHEATDLVPVIQGGIGVRVRRPTDYRDFTLRYRRLVAGAWHNKFEVFKVLQGWMRWCFYGWTQEAQGLLQLGDWMIVDMDKVRAAGLIENALEWGRETKNKDERSTFTWIEIGELTGADAFVAGDVDHAPGRTLSRREIMRQQIPRAIVRLQAKGLAVDIDSVARELGGMVNASKDRDLPVLWPEFEERS